MPNFEIKNVTTGDVQTIEANVIRPATILPIPYVSQLEAGALKFYNDCGPTCGTMLLRGYGLSTDMTPDRFFTETGQAEGLMNITAIRGLLTRYKLNTDYKQGLTISNLFDLLQQQKPSILLVNYGVLVDANLTERRDFKGPHFFLAVGMDTKYVYIHDPYYKGMNGEARPYPIAKFLEAWQRAREQFNNPTCAAVIPLTSLDQAATLQTPVTQPSGGTIPSGTVATGTTGSTTTGGTGQPLYRANVVFHPLQVRDRVGWTSLILDTLPIGAEVTVYEEQIQPDQTWNTWGRIDKDQQRWVLARKDTLQKK